ncbi:MAG: hypothetical protein ACLFRW_06700 [Halorhodospira sp.]
MVVLKALMAVTPFRSVWYRRGAVSAPAAGYCRSFLRLAVLGLVLLLPGSPVLAENGYGGLLAEGWRIGVACGTLAIEEGQSPGTAVTVTLGKGARVVSDREAQWDFELGLGHTEGVEEPAGVGGGVTVRQTDLYYRARRLLADSGWFIGWHVAASRISESPSGGESSRDLGFTGGGIVGWLAAEAATLQLEALVTNPEPDGLGLTYRTQQYRAHLELRF